MSGSEKTILVVEDDLGLQKQLRWSFQGYEVVIAGNREAAITALRRYEPAVVTLDLGLPPDANGSSEGLATLKEILELAPRTKVVVVTGNDDRANAVKAIGLGAYDFYQKPIDAEILRLIVERAVHVNQLEEENRKLSNQTTNTSLRGILATSPQMLKICRTIEKVAPTDITTLLLGESGTGKELLARALHELSPRATKRFVAINCAAIPESLLESELFGHEKGAFTGATKQTIGKIECAHSGTFFLDEVGDLPFPLQAKLLRFLQERVIERIGGREEIPVDVRVICATHQDLSALIQQGKFREDLYYRISEIGINIPPLREREGDIVLLARIFLEKFSQQNKKDLRGFSEGALGALQKHTWMGNVRELENRIKRAVVMADGNLITTEDLELPNAEHSTSPFNLRQVRDEAERSALQHALNLYSGNISQASEALGISRPTLYDLLNKHGMNAKP